MDDLEAIRQRKLRELQERQAAGQDPAATAEAEARRAEAEEAVERLLQRVLEPEARERLTRIRMSRPDLAEAVTSHLVRLAQAGQLRGTLRDEDLRSLLQRIMPPDRDINISRR